MNIKEKLTEDNVSEASDLAIVAPQSRPVIPVKELSERDRGRMLRHFIDLTKNDRLLRFGSYLPDEIIIKYVESIDFSRDKVFGVFNRRLRLAGVGHLAFAPVTEGDKSRDATLKDSVAEFGVSVARSARGKGVGSTLFERGMIHCRNADIDVMYMHCLTSNQTMMHIAKKAGMEIQREYGEADAYLKLPPANVSSVLKEAMQEQVASLDYAIRSNARAAAKWLGSLPGMKHD